MRGNIRNIVLIAIIVAVGFSLSLSAHNHIIAQEIQNKGYLFAEDVSITAEFRFRGGTEVSQFEVFTQKSGFDRAEPFVFELQKIVGNTPRLHDAADLAFHHRSSTPTKLTESEFNVDVLISHNGELNRVFKYSRCFVSDYSVVTEYDKEEGWMGKGFAVLDRFEFQCSAYTPHNPALDKMNLPQEMANAPSSMEYQANQRKLP